MRARVPLIDASVEDVPLPDESLDLAISEHGASIRDDTGEVEFHFGYGDWIRLLRANGLTVENLIEIQAPAEGEPHRFPELPNREWPRRWPAEKIRVARKRT